MELLCNVAICSLRTSTTSKRPYELNHHSHEHLHHEFQRAAHLEDDEIFTTWDGTKAMVKLLILIDSVQRFRTSI